MAKTNLKPFPKPYELPGDEELIKAKKIEGDIYSHQDAAEEFKKNPLIEHPLVQLAGEILQYGSAQFGGDTGDARYWLDRAYQLTSWSAQMDTPLKPNLKNTGRIPEIMEGYFVALRRGHADLAMRVLRTIFSRYELLGPEFWAKLSIFALREIGPANLPLVQFVDAAAIVVTEFDSGISTEIRKANFVLASFLTAHMVDSHKCRAYSVLLTSGSTTTDCMTRYQTSPVIPAVSDKEIWLEGRLNGLSNMLVAWPLLLIGSPSVDAKLFAAPSAASLVGGLHWASYGKDTYVGLDAMVSFWHFIQLQDQCACPSKGYMPTATQSYVQPFNEKNLLVRVIDLYVTRLLHHEQVSYEVRETEAIRIADDCGVSPLDVKNMRDVVNQSLHHYVTCVRDSFKTYEHKMLLQPA